MYGKIMSLTDFKDAKTMRLVTRNAMMIKAGEELGPIMDEIKYAAKNAEYNVTISKKLSKSTINFMTENGYRIREGEDWTEISWEK